jgi:hypothetical protein
MGARKVLIEKVYTPVAGITAKDIGSADPVAAAPAEGEVVVAPAP